VAAPASPLTQLNSPAQPPRAKARRRLAAEPEDSDRYRLHVVATTIADVVAAIGGLIFDRAMAGWDITVAVDGNTDDRAIRILGGRVADCAQPPHVLAVATDVFVTNERVRRLSLAAGQGRRV